MKTNRWSLLLGLSLAFLPCCAKNTAPSPAPIAAHTGAVKPDPARARAHLTQHVTYPATRSQVLEACASTKEFSDAEKQWFSDNLPEGQYASAHDVVSALKLDAGCAEPAAATCKD